jgi:hypothetical protein
MKKVIELLERVRSDIVNNYVDEEHIPLFMGEDVVSMLNEVLAILKSPPRLETPEQYRERTGRDWPENALVYYRYVGASEIYVAGEWSYAAYKRIRGFAREEKKYKSGRYQIVCATEAGIPPDDWKPEGTQ